MYLDSGVLLLRLDSRHRFLLMLKKRTYFLRKCMVLLIRDVKLIDRRLTWRQPNGINELLSQFQTFDLSLCIFMY